MQNKANNYYQQFAFGCGHALLLTIIALHSSVSLAQDGDKQQKDGEKPTADSIEVDKNQKTPIFVFDISGGMQLAAVEKQPPRFQLYADGSIISGGRPGTVQVKGKLTPDELNTFLNLVVKTNDFYGIDQKKLEEKIKAGKKRVTLADAPFTKFSIDIKKGKKAISVYALFNSIQNFPKMDELVRLRTIEFAVAKIVSKIHLDGKGEEVLKVVNEAVKNKKGYDIKPFTLDELYSAKQMRNGRFQVLFTRKPTSAGPMPANAEPQPDLNVIYFKKDRISEPAISFYGLPPKK